MQFFDDCRDVAQQINASVCVQQIFHATGLDVRHWRETALIRPPKGAVADTYLLKKIPWPTSLRFRLDDHRLAFLADEHFRAFEPIILWQPDRLRPTGDEEFGSIHVDTVSMLSA